METALQKGTLYGLENHGKDDSMKLTENIHDNLYNLLRLKLACTN